ncbi:MAG: hypothetical protein ABS75_10450 [Pelagibacterium sp. SCN 63-23]|nr:MAG: hypothetical protein ABS75_10450 [Pelagibacterium sp. SCN 63-23]
MESNFALASIRRRISADLTEFSRKEGWDNSAELKDADDAMARALTGCFLDRRALAASARDSDGFPGSATRLVLAALAEREPLTFGTGASPVARRYAELVIRTALEAAVENEAYFRALEPHLLFETLRGIGTLENAVTEIGKGVVTVQQTVEITAETVNKILAGVEQLGRQVENLPTPTTAFTVNADAGARSRASFLLNEPNSIIVGWTHAPGDWWERVGRALNSALDRLSSAGALVPQRWNFGSLGQNVVAHEIQDALWRPLSVPDSPHVATIVHIGINWGPWLAMDERFERRLAKRSYLAEGVEQHGFVDVAHMEAGRRRAMVDAGAIPLNAETRLIAETMLAEKPLVVWDGSGDDKPESVRVLLNWLRDRNVAIIDDRSLVDEEDAWALGFVAQIFGIRADQIPNPYRKLDHYSPSDAANYRGRDAEAGVALAWLRDALQGRQTPILSIGGSSGVGKSSFLNARIAPIGRENGLTYVTFRPTDFEAAPSTIFSPIRDFCGAVENVVGNSMGLEKYPLIKAGNLERAKSAALAWISSLKSSGIRLLIGVDQFEEILDNIHNGWNGAAWRSLLELFAELTQGAGSVLAITLESSREDVLARLLKDTLFARARVINLRDDDEAFLRQVISEPFAAVGFELGEDIVTKLVAETRRHQDDVGRSSSALPLLSLKLYSLFAFLSQKRALQGETVSSNFSSASSEISLGDLKGISLDLADEIASLADQAWSETGGGSDNDLDQFIRPYVRVISTENGTSSRIVLQAVPERGFYSMATRQSAFVRRRLIVPTATGFRLVHESVIRRWSLANAWLERERESLLRQSALASDALQWRANGRPDFDRPSVDEIAQAARFLMASVVDWFNDDDLPEAIAIEREYCLALFSHANDPRMPVLGSIKGTAYIYLAACYGMLDLLERFLRNDTEAVNLRRPGDNSAPLTAAAWVSAPAVAKLLEWGADPNNIDDGGFLPIDAAIWGGNQAVFDLLLPLTDPALCIDQPSNPLYGAAARNRPGMMDRLEIRGFRHDSPSKHGFTPLMGAVYGNSAQMFQYCLARGDPLARDDYGRNVFDHAAMGGILEFQQMIIEHPQGLDALAPNPSDGRTALMHACGAQMFKSADFLLRAGIDPNAAITSGEDEGRTALHFCLDWLSRWKASAPRHVVEKTRATLVVLLSADGIDVNAASRKGETAYTMLVYHEDLRELIAAHPSFDWLRVPVSMDTPLDRAIAAKDRALVETLLQDQRHRRVVDRIKADGGTPSSAMIENGMGDLVGPLIESGEVAAWRDTSNNSGLLSAALKARDAGLVRMIVDRMPEQLTSGQLESFVGAKVVYGASRGFDTDDALFGRAIASMGGPADLAAALLEAGLLGSKRLVLRLMEAGAPFWDVDEWQRTALDKSADSIRNDPEVQAAERFGRVRRWTPQERRILVLGNLEDIRILLEAGGERAQVDDWGRMPSDLVPDVMQADIMKMKSGARQ